MNASRQIALLTLLAALLGCVLPASAVTLGRLKGSALLGQPLEVVATVEFAAGEPVSVECLTATVSYGAIPLAAGQVAVTQVPGGREQTLSVLISTTAVVNEPVVNVTLSVGCGQRASRQYVLLSDLASDPSAGSLPTRAALSATGNAQGTSVPEANTARPAVSPTKTTKPAASSSSFNKADGVNPQVSQGLVRAPSAEKNSLRDNGRKQGALKLSSPAASVGSGASKSAIRAEDLAAIEDLTRRVEAISEWKASKEEQTAAPKVDESLAVLQQSLTALQIVTAKNTKDLQLVAQAVEASEAKSNTGNWLYAAFGLVFLALAGLAWALLQSRRTAGEPAPWWGPTHANEALAGPRAPQSTNGMAVPPPASAPTESKEVDIDLGTAPVALVTTASALSSPKIAEIKRVDKRDFAQSASAHLRSVNTKEMFDVRQQAEFFMALGQHDEAIQVLEGSNVDSEESNPLVLLDLLRILHTLSRRAEFDRYRTEFNATFTGLVPVYAKFAEEGNGLDAYPAILKQLQSLWPSDDAQDYLEQCMVRTPDDDAETGFDLDAFRDLLMLHAVLRRLDTTELDSDLAPFSANRTSSAALDSNVAPLSEPTAFLTGADDDGAQLPELPPVDSMAPDKGAAANTFNLDLDLELPADASNLIEFDLKALPSVKKPGG